MALLLALGAGLGYSFAPGSTASAGRVSRTAAAGPLMMPKATPMVSACLHQQSSFAPEWSPVETPALLDILLLMLAA